MGNNPFLGRSLTSINNFTKDELFYLFDKTRVLKQLLNKKKKSKEDIEAIDSYRINDENFIVYLMFIEHSTRTFNSFFTAFNKFHKVQCIPFDAEHSSLNKGESYKDTVNTLVGYGARMLVLRTKLEGVCKHLQMSTSDFVKRRGLPYEVSLFNAGDGQLEHPTQTILDVFSYLEDNEWNSSYIHVAHIGDLLQGRTIHSQILGLIKTFDSGMVDFIAPKELQIPEEYIELLVSAGFEIRKFSSIEEYLKLPKKEIARCWYFTRVQKERLPEHLKPMVEKLRSWVIFKKEFLQIIPEGLLFYHPQPRYNKAPAIPYFLDNTPMNRWNNQSDNGYLTRVVEASLFAGKIGDDFGGEIYKPDIFEDDFIQEEAPHPPKPDGKYVMKPVKNGVMIDHICPGDNEDELGDYLTKIRKIMGIKYWYDGVRCSKSGKRLPKGMLFLEDYKVSESKIKKLAAVAPGCTVNIIEKGKIIKKLRLSMPPRIYNLPDLLSCTHPDCIANAIHYEGTINSFTRINNSTNKLVCDYCKKEHSFKEIWIK